MNKETKIKVIIFAVIGLLVLIVFLVFLSSGGDNDNKQIETTVHSDVPAEFTMDDMLKVNEKTQNKRNPYATEREKADLSTYQEEDPDVLRLQRILEQNRAKEDSAVLENKRRMQLLVDSIKGNISPETPTPKPPILAEKVDTITPIATEPPAEPEKKNRFFNPARPQPKKNTVEAVVHGTQELRNGSSIKMRLTEDLETPNGQIIPKDTYVFGKVSLSGERMNVKIESVRINDYIFPLEMTVYDKDGMQGINVPQSIQAEAIAEATQRGLNQVRMPYSDNLLESGVSAVTEAGKTVISKQTRVIKVTVKSNYQIFLKDEK